MPDFTALIGTLDRRLFGQVGNQQPFQPAIVGSTITSALAGSSDAVAVVAAMDALAVVPTQRGTFAKITRAERVTNANYVYRFIDETNSLTTPLMAVVRFGPITDAQLALFAGLGPDMPALALMTDSSNPYFTIMHEGGR